MSPVVVGPGYTRDFIDGRVSKASQDTAVVNGFAAVGEGCDTVVIEGTGHTGVGSIIGLNNARAAALLEADRCREPPSCETHPLFYTIVVTKPSLRLCAHRNRNLHRLFSAVLHL